MIFCRRHSACLVLALLIPAAAQGGQNSASRLAPEPAQSAPAPASPRYRALQQRLAQGWNTWDVHSVTTQVLLPEGLAIHMGLKHNTTEGGDAFLEDALIGRLTPGAEQVTPGPHSWDGSYTDLPVAWQGHRWRVQSAHAGADLVLLVTPLPSSANNRSAADRRLHRQLPLEPPRQRHSPRRFHPGGRLLRQPVHLLHLCPHRIAGRPIDRRYPSALRTSPPTSPAPSASAPGGVARWLRFEGHRRSGGTPTNQSVTAAGTNGPILDAIQTTLGWDTIYEPSNHRVISPVSRVWSVGWGGYVLFDWDTFFAATMASIGDRDLAYANALEILREETPQGFVPNYARAGNWKSSDRSEPPVGAITVLGLYRQFHDRWFLEDAFAPLLRWNRWWDQHRQIQGYLAWGSDPDNQPANLDDTSRGTHQGAEFESGLDNSPMYDGTFYNPHTHLLEYADVGMMSLYIADCDALAEIAGVLDHPGDQKELADRAARYRAKLATLWDPQTGHLSQQGSAYRPVQHAPLAHQLLSAARARARRPNRPAP